MAGGMKTRGPARPVVSAVTCYLAVGGVINVAAAWSAVLWIARSGWPLHTEVQVGHFASANGTFVVDRQACFGFEECVVAPDSTPMPDAQVANAWMPVWSVDFVERSAGLDDQECDVISAAGWPSRAFLSVYRMRAGSEDAANAVHGLVIFALQTPAGWYHALPLKPFWPGLVLNWVAYALLVGGATHGYRHLKGTWRHRRGRCRACGYNLRDLQRCPECGRA